MVLRAVESENGAVLTYRLDKSQFTIGSSSKNDVVVRSSGIGDRHLVMQRSGASFTFVTTDRQSVVLNGERRSRGVLNPGDRLRMGSMTLIYRGHDATVQERTEDATPGAASSRTAGDSPVFLSDPSGFAAARTRLAERREDLLLLITRPIQRVSREQGKRLRGLTLECLNSLLARPFRARWASWWRRSIAS